MNGPHVPHPDWNDCKIERKTVNISIIKHNMDKYSFANESQQQYMKGQ